MAALGKARFLLQHKCSVYKLSGCRYFSVQSVRHSESKSPVGFIGLGNMGGPMAKNLIKNGYSVTVFDVSEQSKEDLRKAGANVVSSPAAVASEVDTIVTMLPSNPHVIEVYTGKSGILSTVKPGSLLIDSSTIDPMVSIDMAEQCSKKNATFMDAPVSGGVLAAASGALTFMVGGPASEFPAAKIILENMGKNVIHCGGVGTGEAAKVCNNMMLAISMIGASETMNMGIKLGLEPKVLKDVLCTSSARCWSLDTYNPVPGVLEGVPSSKDYQGGFATELMDLGLAQNVATTLKSPTPLGSLAHQIYRVMCNKGYARKDFSSAYMFLQDEKEEK
ncbi:3-hydroxyisobutyrate dehydrogenase, mitochondrial isoform X2 [Lingula anatina]|uniref:3-hydroxyisobutyrate dehydrogenase n=1 Tax=Lingula anatina TaxID=7574 RepID=A0A1S3JBA6_LINAN|nr:3-hydroxyisobutyrate dehydrogenase, mitochondrial isoform X2 [Lingula anatina]|eukprot:XP_013407608.1 3-hydroxyisobutyrate dehydrogenase, mitochondrial isoform X2 [Lingula anatina]